MIDIVTGGSGFLGLNFIENYKYDLSNLFVIKHRNILEKYKNNFIDLDTLETTIQNRKEKIRIYHFATLYSLDENYKSEIYESNLNFGKRLFQYIPTELIDSIIYTNTMFSFNELHKNSSYVTSKNMFSKYLKESFDNEIIFEVFLDNTFGHNDNRDKIIPIIFEAVRKGKPNPVKNKEVYLNFTNVLDVIEYLNENKFEKNSFKLVSNKNHNLFSIFESLNEYNSSPIKKINPILNKDSSFTLDSPPTPKDFNNRNFEESIQQSFKDFINLQPAS